MRFILFVCQGIISYWLCSCGSRSELPTATHFILEKTDSVRIKVNDKTNIQGVVQLISYQNQEWLCSFQYEPGFNNFHLYDLDNRVYYKTMRFASEGPDGIGKVSPVMAFISFDSIFLYRVNSNIFYRVDSSGTLLTKIDLTKIDNGTIHVSLGFPHIINQNELCFFRIEAENPNSRKFLKKAKAEGIYNLRSGIYQNDRPSYPDYPHGFEASMENWKVSRCVGPNNEFVYSFPFDNHLYVYKNGSINKFAIPNDVRPLNTTIAITIDPLNIESQMQFTATLGMYTYLLYDSINRLYYRVYLRPGNHKDNEGNVIKVADFAWDLELIDEQFRIVGRQTFPAKIYNPYGILISKMGILISHINPYLPTQEDYFIYSVFRPVRSG
ncbi:MAG: DUF4221 family protein [Sediminibacterium sp.]